MISDTHIGDGASNRLDDRVLEAAASADVILHAGDVTGRALLDELRGLAPVHAVLGNNDGALDQLLPVTLDVALDGVQVSMVHDAGARQGRPERSRHASRQRTWSCSDTRTCPRTSRPPPARGSSTPEARPSGDEHRFAPSGSSR